MYFIFAKCFKCFKAVNLQFLNDNAMEKTPTKKEIIVSYGTISEICNTLKVSRATVFRALRFKGSSAKQERIRLFAIKKGGVLSTTDNAKEK